MSTSIGNNDNRHKMNPFSCQNEKKNISNQTLVSNDNIVEHLYAAKDLPNIWQAAS